MRSVRFWRPNLSYQGCCCRCSSSSTVTPFSSSSYYYYYLLLLYYYLMVLARRSAQFRRWSAQVMEICVGVIERWIRGKGKLPVWLVIVGQGSEIVAPQQYHRQAAIIGVCLFQAIWFSRSPKAMAERKSTSRWRGDIPPDGMDNLIRYYWDFW